MDLEKLCNDLNIEYDWMKPRDTVNRVIRSLSDSSDQDVTTLLLMDEVSPSYDDTPDWRDLAVRENVVWLLGLSPFTWSSSSSKVLPPENSSVLTRHLVHQHRNCLQIRNVIKKTSIELFILNIFLIILVLQTISGIFASIISLITTRTFISLWMMTKTY